MKIVYDILTSCFQVIFISSHDRLSKQLTSLLYNFFLTYFNFFTKITYTKKLFHDKCLCSISCKFSW